MKGISYLLRISFSLLVGFCPFFSLATPAERLSDLVVSPVAFEKFGDFMLWHNSERSRAISFDPQEVFEGAVIYVLTEMMEEFFCDYHPKIPHRYLLLTHNTDHPAPGRFKHYLDDDKIIAWLGMNPSCRHHKFHLIPLGICSHQEDYREVFSQIMAVECQRDYLLYLNFDMRFKDERKKIYEMFHGKHYCFSCSRKPLDAYLLDLKGSLFVLSPEGVGLDCFRTWEALLMGAIPIVKTSYLDPLFKDLPVVIVKDWHQINKSFLWKRWRGMKNRHYSLDKLYLSYWSAYVNQILKKEGIDREFAQ